MMVVMTIICLIMVQMATAMTMTMHTEVVSVILTASCYHHVICCIAAATFCGMFRPASTF